MKEKITSVSVRKTEFSAWKCSMYFQHCDFQYLSHKLDLKDVHQYGKTQKVACYWRSDYPTPIYRTINGIDMKDTHNKKIILEIPILETTELCKQSDLPLYFTLAFIPCKELAN